MSKKMKVIISALIALLLLTAGGTAVVLAEDNPNPAATPAAGIKNAFLARVAQILGITEEKLTGAMKQTHQELAQEAFEKYVDKASDGTITEEEASQIKDWWKTRPEALSRLLPAAVVQWRFSEEILNQAVKNNRITLGEADQITEWWESRPMAVDRLLPRVRIQERINRFKEELKERLKEKIQKEKRGANLDDAFQRFLENAAKRGTISSQEAENITRWWSTRPEIVNSLLPLGLLMQGPSDSFAKMIDKLAEKGRITPAQATEIKTWWENRPPELSKLLPKAFKLPAIRGKVQPRGAKPIPSPTVTTTTTV